ncbi:MAG: hypothetical protein IH921_06360 [Gemmatimonadetes bacterium]|nr:hypothetical protein [Gemmatimonadota bacterium]
MPESRYHKARSEQVIAVRFRMKASADEVVARLLDSVRGTDLSLLKVFGDGDRVYPFEGRNPARSASSWRAELFWHSPTLMSGWILEIFLKRAKFFLGLGDRVQLELGGGRRNPREYVGGVRRARLWRSGDEVPAPLDKKS